MDFCNSDFRRQCRRSAGHWGIGAALLIGFGLAGFGCGGSSSHIPVVNGNTSSTATVSSSTTGGSSSDGPPFQQTGTPLANASLPAGVWYGSQNVDGGINAGSLQVSSSGGQFSLHCGHSAQYSGPIMLDANGSFQVLGTGYLQTNPLEPADSGKVLFQGKVETAILNGKSETDMLLTVSDAVSGIGDGTFVLILGDTALAYDGPCPGA